MQPLTTDQLRQAYRDFFVQKHGHAEIPGASLIPENDPTVLFTTAGMHPLVPYLLGEKHPSGQCLVSCQRCVRTQDIDEVGDASHLTFFEMLGNWSLGSASAADGIGHGGYFKEGAIRMSFQFLTEVLGMPAAKLAISCFAGDADAPRDEASARTWELLGIPHERIGFLPKAKNWWGPAGSAGPCGPDTEMFFWIGPTELPPPGSNPANDEKNWLEIWNDVFMEYNRKATEETDATEATEEFHGKYLFEPLRQKNVDTGMGLERVAQVLQGVGSVYETDRLKTIFECVYELSPKIKGRPGSGSATERDARIITDHLRAATFIIADGVEPSNVDRGYILRRLLRRAIRAGRTIAISQTESWTPTVAKKIITNYGNYYSSLKNNEQKIYSILQHEEELFKKTLLGGLKEVSKTHGKIDGRIAFHFFETYGFPLELTIELAREQGRPVDKDIQSDFRGAFTEHQKLSRAGAEKRFAGGLSDHSAETMKLHTALHLLNAALRKILGPHVQQKGSNITAERLRFDFSHPAKVTPEQIKEVERLVNTAIAADLPVTCHVTTVKQAKAEGAIGVFDERYGADVKVYVIGPKECHGEPVEPPFSREICGGPHVARTGMLGTFTIQKEEAVSAGVRRIKAVVAEEMNAKKP